MGYADGDGCFTRSIKDGQGKKFCLTSIVDQDWSFMKILFKQTVVSYTMSKRIFKKGRGSVFNTSDYESIFKIGKYIYGKGEYEGFGYVRKYNAFLSILNGASDKTKRNLGIDEFLKTHPYQDDPLTTFYLSPKHTSMSS